MPKRRVHHDQLDFHRHADAPERQRLADDLKAEIDHKQHQLRRTRLFLRLLLEDERDLGNRPGHWEQWELQARETELVADLRKLEKKLCQLGGHPNFRTPVVEGYGLADALRELRK